MAIEVLHIYVAVTRHIDIKVYLLVSDDAVVHTVTKTREGVIGRRQRGNTTRHVAKKISPCASHVVQ